MKKKIKILHVINSCNPIDGGPIEGVKQFSKEYINHDINVEILCSDKKNSQFLKTNNLPRVHAIGPGLFKYNYNYRMIPWLKKNIHRFDFLIINGIWQYHNYAVWKVAKLFNKEYFIFTHGMLDPWFNKKYPFKYFKKIIYWYLIQYKILKDAKKILFTSKLENFLASKSFPNIDLKKKTIGYGIKGNPFINFKKNFFLKKFPFLEKKTFILYLGRIAEKKGLDILISAFNKFKEKNIYLIIAGDYQNYYGKKIFNITKKQKNKKILWVGALYNRIKWDAYRSASLFCLPSHQENFGISIVEALSSKVPVLITNKVNIHSIIKKYNCGFVSNDNLIGINNSLNKWLRIKNSKTNQIMKYNAFNCFQKNFKIDQVVKNLKTELLK